MNEDEKRRLLESPCNETEAAKIEALEKKNEALKKEKEALKKEKEALKKEKEAVEKEKDALEDRMNSVAYRYRQMFGEDDLYRAVMGNTCASASQGSCSQD
jgi:FtsZ-binding cell division protein ZapB